MWRSRLINFCNLWNIFSFWQRKQTVPERKDAISFAQKGWVRDVIKYSSLCFYRLIWCLRNERCEARRWIYWQERSWQELWHFSIVSSTCSLPFLFFVEAMITGGACSINTGDWRNESASADNREKSSHHKFIWMCKGSQQHHKKKWCIHPLLSELTMMFDDLPSSEGALFLCVSTEHFRLDKVLY